MLFWKRVVVGDTERVLVIRNGRFDRILESGTHVVFRFPRPVETLAFEVHSTRQLTLASEWALFLATERRELAARYFHIVETGETQVAMVFIDRRLSRVVGPGQRVLFWKGAAEFRAEVLDARPEPEVPAGSLPALERLGREAPVAIALVEEGSAGLLFVDNRLLRVLKPGRYGFWNIAGGVRVDSIDLRRQTLEISGQEILTKDKVSIRVNVSAEYQVADPVLARQSVRDFSAQLYRALQLSVRQTLGTKTLEEILADKTGVDGNVAAEVRGAMAESGVAVANIALKDIILPGDMREMLNQVVSAEKQAQANLIRRREETAATRSLLNTARLLEENPILIRLKELETLEKLMDKVDRVTVTNGFEGLLENLVTLKTSK